MPLTFSVGGTSGHGRLYDFANAEGRDRWRSSWTRFPRTVASLVAARHNGSPASAPSFQHLRELFAVQCSLAGLYVPANYEQCDPHSPVREERDYQLVRGQGSGRRPPTAVPRSLQQPQAANSTQGHHAIAELDLDHLDERRVDLRRVNANVIILCVVVMQTSPLILAMLNGFEVVGADLRQPTHRSIGLAVATRWAEQAIGAASSTFLVGDYGDGARLFTAPVNLDPMPNQIVRTSAERKRRARLGSGLAWCTLAALAGTIAYDPAARAAAACSAISNGARRLPC